MKDDPLITFGSERPPPARQQLYSAVTRVTTRESTLVILDHNQDFLNSNHPRPKELLPVQNSSRLPKTMEPMLEDEWTGHRRGCLTRETQVFGIQKIVLRGEVPLPYVEEVFSRLPSAGYSISSLTQTMRQGLFGRQRRKRLDVDLDVTHQ